MGKVEIPDIPALAKERDRLKEEIKAFHSLIDEIKEAFEAVRESASCVRFGDTTTISSAADGLLIALDCIIGDPVSCLEFAHALPDDSLKDKLTYEAGLRLRYQKVPELEAIVQAELDGVVHDGRPE